MRRVAKNLKKCPVVSAMGIRYHDRAQLEKIYTPASADRARAYLNRIKMLLKGNSIYELRPPSATKSASVEKVGLGTMHKVHAL